MKASVNTKYGPPEVLKINNGMQIVPSNKELEQKIIH